MLARRCFYRCNWRIYRRIYRRNRRAPVDAQRLGVGAREDLARLRDAEEPLHALLLRGRVGVRVGVRVKVRFAVGVRV